MEGEKQSQGGDDGSHVGEEVFQRSLPAAPHAYAHVLQNVIRIKAAHYVVGVIPLAKLRMPEHVVLCPLLRVAQNSVGFVNLLELLRSRWVFVPVWVVSQSQLPVDALQFVCACVSFDAQDIVIAFCHLLASQARIGGQMHPDHFCHHEATCLAERQA